MAKIGDAGGSSEERNSQRQYEKLESIGVTKVFSDKLSGKNNNRPKLQEMLNYIRESDIIVVTELDHLGRNNKEVTYIMNQIQEKKLHLKSLICPL